MSGLASSKSTDSKSTEKSTAREGGSLRAGSGRLAGALTAALLVLAGPIASLGVGVSPAAATTPTSTWTQLSPATSPPARYAASMAYDPGSGAHTGELVLFGGTTTLSLSTGTWTWNGTTWTEFLPVPSPPARFFASMAYDAATRQLVLFGGEDRSGDIFSDTWTWNGTTWTHQFPAASPPARSDASMAYDAGTGQLVLFGGYGNAGPLGDTWTWNGTTWTHHVPAASPPVSSDASMAYDAGSGQLVLFGGIDSDGNVLNETWVWNGTTWTMLSPAKSPPAASDASMAYDAGTGQLLLFGGVDSDGNVVGTTWTWNGTTWTELFPAASPPARSDASMDYDAASSQLVLFGGADDEGSALGDTWTFFVTPSVTVTSNSGVVAGGTLTFTAKVAGPTGAATPRGTLTWAVTPPGGGSVPCSSTTGPSGSSNVATYTCSITGAIAGSYSATASYPGDSIYSPASGSDASAAVKSPSTTSLSVSRSSVTYGAEKSEVFTATVTGADGREPTGTVTIKDGSMTLCSTTALTHKGADVITATCSLSDVELAVGSYSASASYSGDDRYAGSTSSAKTFSVTKDSTTLTVSESLTRVGSGDESATVFTVTAVTGNGEAVPDGTTVTVHVGSATCTVTLKGGTGTCTIPESALRVGTYTVTASFSGDTNLAASTIASSTPLTVSSGTTVPVNPTGQPWSGQLYWWLVGAMGFAGLALFEFGRRRRVRSNI